MRYKIVELIVTCGYIGKIKFAPGTFGSLLAFPIFALLSHMFLLTGYVLPLPGYGLLESQIITYVCFMLLATLAIFVCGVITSTIYIKDTKQDDPKEVVVDEVVGQLLTITLTIFVGPLLWYNSISTQLIDFVVAYAMPFILFRLFDILKPWPINYIDQNMKTGLGIMLDDVLASILATISAYAIVLLVLEYYSAV